MENKQTHPIQLMLPLSPATAPSLIEPLRGQVLCVLSRLPQQVAQTAPPGVPDPLETGAEHAL